MNDRIYLHLVRDEHTGSTLSLGSQPLQIGRAPSNDLVLADSTVSWHHAVLWQEGGSVWVRDLGSRNGTFVNRAKIDAPTRLQAGDLVRVADVAEIQVSESSNVSAPRSYIVEDVDSAAAFPVRSDRFNVGSGDDADLFVEGVDERAATLIFHANGELWVGTDEAEFAIEEGETFEVAQRKLRVREVDPTQVPTIEADTDRYPYRVETTLNGASGPEAKILDLKRNRTYLISADNRAILLHLLVRKIVEDQESGKQPEDQGWCSDDEIRVGIWGRRADQDANSLHVLVYRLRSELKRAGFDPWFIEKRRKAIRARVKEAHLE